MKYGVSQPVTRKEDQRLLTGQGRYTDDHDLEDQAIAYVLRSPHAHAVIRGIDARAAGTAPGVVCVLTGADLEADGLGLPPCLHPPANRDGSHCTVPPHALLKRDRVRHVGDPVALVVAETLDQARDAAELIEIDYEPLPVVTDTARAIEPGAPQLWDFAPRNINIDWEVGDEAATDAAFAAAAHVTRLDLVNNRVVVNPMEPRAALGAYDAEAGSYLLYVPSQTSHMVRDILARDIFGIAPDKVRVITPDVGGGFGMKVFFAEYALVLWAARKIGRPVKWTCERSHGFLSDSQGRDHVTHAELALDSDGKFLAVRAETIANMGGYLATFGPNVPAKKVQPAVYDIRAAYVSVKTVYTNTVPVDAYRGAGRPEATYVIERLIDVAAGELGIAPGELRRRNYIPPEAMPYTTVFDMTYDSGEFARNMDDAVALADWQGFAARRDETRAAGKLRGIGMAYYVDTTGGPVIDAEYAGIRFESDGTMTVLSGCQASGQGHETAYAQLVVERLGAPFDKVNVHQGDTLEIPKGYGTGGSRSLMDGGGAVLAAADEVIENGKRLAAKDLEVAAADLEFADGHYRVAGTDRRIGLFDVAALCRAEDGVELSGEGIFRPQATSFPNGCHVCEVEIDPDTGAVALMGYTVVDDFGRVVNPLLVAGQVHGGVVQGVGQALVEHTVYDDDTGQLLTGTFMDYGMPRASDLPHFTTQWNEIPCLTNPLGVKGAAEAGTVGALPAVINAIVDALAEFGVTHVDMPATPEHVWQTLRSAERARPGR